MNAIGVLPIVPQLAAEISRFNRWSSVLFFKAVIHKPSIQRPCAVPDRMMSYRFQPVVCLFSLKLFRRLLQSVMPGVDDIQLKRPGRRAVQYDTVRTDQVQTFGGAGIEPFD